MRIAFDTNVLVSAFATRGLSADILNLVLAEHQLVLGETVLDELARVLRTKLRAPPGIVTETVTFLRAQAVVIGSAPPLGFELRDKDDEPVLAEAIQGLAEVLVTGDADLLSVTQDVPIRILTPRGLWEALTEDSV